jgi:sulfate adenylyltransferase
MESLGLPVVFDTSDEALVVGDKVLLTQDGAPIGRSIMKFPSNGVHLNSVACVAATINVQHKYAPNKPLEALKCYGTTSIEVSHRSSMRMYVYTHAFEHSSVRSILLCA